MWKDIYSHTHLPKTTSLSEFSSSPWKSIDSSKTSISKVFMSSSPPSVSPWFSSFQSVMPWMDDAQFTLLCVTLTLFFVGGKIRALNPMCICQVQDQWFWQERREKKSEHRSGTRVVCKKKRELHKSQGMWIRETTLLISSRGIFFSKRIVSFTSERLFFFLSQKISLHWVARVRWGNTRKLQQDLRELKNETDLSYSHSGLLSIVIAMIRVTDGDEKWLKKQYRFRVRATNEPKGKAEIIQKEKEFQILMM